MIDGIQVLLALLKFDSVYVLEYTFKAPSLEVCLFGSSVSRFAAFDIFTGLIFLMYTWGGDYISLPNQLHDFPLLHLLPMFNQFFNHTVNATPIHDDSDLDLATTWLWCSNSIFSSCPIVR